MLKRVTGTLEKYCLTAGKAEAWVRVGNDLMHVPMVNRGILQEDKTIRRCINGERLAPLAGVRLVEAEIDYHDEGRTEPFIVLFAPR